MCMEVSQRATTTNARHDQVDIIICPESELISTLQQPALVLSHVASKPLTDTKQPELSLFNPFRCHSHCLQTNSAAAAAHGTIRFRQ